MGVLSLTVFTVCILVGDFVSFVFCSWVLSCVYKNASDVVKKQTQRRIKWPKTNSDVLCPCLFNRLSTVEFTMGISVICVALFVLAAAIQLTDMSVLLITCFGCDKGEWPAFQLWFLAVYVVVTTLGYALMFVTHFERLRLTFQNTQHRLPQWAPNCLYAAMSFSTFDMALICVLFYIEPMASAILWAFQYFVYFSSVSALIRTFFKKTMAIGSAHNDQKLTATAVRITVSVSISLLSTTLFSVLMVIWVSGCEFCLIWILVSNTMLSFDMCLNAFCLMCTFRGAEIHYQRVFGVVHNWLLKRVTADSLVIEQTNEIVASNIGSLPSFACETAQTTD